MKNQQSIKSFVKRSKRLTSAQKLYLCNKNKNINYFTPNKIIDYFELFKNTNPCILDIGFGDGKLLVNIAKKYQEINFIGIEVYDSGIGNILKQISKENLYNLKITKFDAVEFLENNVNDISLDGISLFFPDPWPKKKHHKRRILNAKFLDLLSKKIKSGGFVKIATDWENYGNDIIETFEKNSKFEKTNDIDLFKFRPITKFEKRGITLGHKIFELSYKLK